MQSLPEQMYLKKVSPLQINQRHIDCFGRTPPVLKKTLKMLNFDGLFSLKSLCQQIHLTFSKFFKRICQEGTKLSIFSILQETRIHRSKEK